MIRKTYTISVPATDGGADNSSSNNNSTAGGNSSADANSTSDSVKKIIHGAIAATLPATAEILALHAPIDIQPNFNIIFRLPDGGLRLHAADGGFSSIGATWDDATMGTFVKAVCHDNVVTLIGSQRTSWLIRNPSDGRYSWRTVLPTAPICTISHSRAILPPYVNAVGDEAEINVTCRATTSIAPSRENIARWLDEYRDEWVDWKFRLEVRDAVRDALADYIDAVRDADLTTSPQRWVAALGNSLPTEIFQSEETHPHTLRLKAWGYEDGVLQMTLLCSAVPLQTTVHFSITADNLLWSDYFPKLSLYAATPVDWWLGTRTPMITIYEGGQFNMFLKSDDKLRYSLENSSDFRLVKEFSTAKIASGVAVIPEFGVGEIYTPDYTDHERLRALGGSTSDSGVTLFNENILMLPRPGVPFLFPRRLRIGERDILAVAPSCGSRTLSSGGEAPLLCFTDEGIRRVSFAADGTPYVANLISNIPAASDICSLHPEGVMFLAEGGVMLATATAVKMLAADYPGDLSAVAEIGWLDGGNLLLLREGEKCIYYDVKQKEWFESELIVKRLLRSGGSPYIFDEHGHLAEIYSQETLLPPPSSAESDVSTPSDIAEDTRNIIDLCPLDVGCWYERKRVERIVFEQGSGWVLYAADIAGAADSGVWQRVISGIGSDSGPLHLPAFRYWRLVMLGNRPPQRVAVSVAQSDRDFGR